MRKNFPVTGHEHVLPDGVMLVSNTDLKGRITFANEAFVDASGFSESELLGKAHNIVRHPDMPEEAFLDLWRTLEAGKPWTGLVKNRRKNGDHYWVLANATPIREADKVTGYMSVRSKPSRQQVAAAEAAYAQFREGRARGLAIHEGNVVSALWLRLNVLGRLPLLAKLAAVSALISVPAFLALALLFEPALFGAARPFIAAALTGVALIGVACFGRFALSLAATLRASAAKVQALTQGRFDCTFEAHGEDELAALLCALQSLRTKVGFELADSRRLAVESKRVREALDVAQANVMVTDASHDIVYANRSLIETLTSAEQDIRAELPSFSAAEVVGSNIDLFHKNPAHQREILSRLTAPHRTRLTFGTRKLDLVITPVADADGRRLGTVVEWVDRTAEWIGEEIQFVLGAAGNGDLTRRVRLGGKSGFFENLALGINGLLDTNTSLIRDVKRAAGEVSSGADEIARGNLSLSQRTEAQASSLEETAASMEAMTSIVKHNADSAAQANELAAAARQQAEKSGQVVTEAVHAMQGINAASTKIADIIGVIDGISFQTNLLALNAAVEAARAGDQGRGFAVVASEVRSLASRSAEAAKEIKTLITDSVGKVARGTALVDESGRTLAEIVTSVKKVSDIVSEIAAASREQATGIDQVNRAVTSMEDVTTQNAALVEEAAAAAQSLLDQARGLDQVISAFQVIEESAPQWTGQDRRKADTWRTGSTVKPASKPKPPANEKRRPPAPPRQRAVAPRAHPVSPAAPAARPGSPRSTGTDGAADWEEF